MAVSWVWERKSKEREMFSLLLSCQTPMPMVFVSAYPFRSSTLLCGYCCCPRASFLWKQKKRAALCQRLASSSDILITASFSLVQSHREWISPVDLRNGAFIRTPPWLLTRSHVGSWLLCWTFTSLHNFLSFYFIDSEFLPQIDVEKPYTRWRARSGLRGWISWDPSEVDRLMTCEWASRLRIVNKYEV